jgi:hypoxanthine phosphoribosyltransferase
MRGTLAYEAMPQARLREIHGAREVEARIEQLAALVRRGCADRRPLLVAIAEGARRFATRLAAALEASGLEPELLFLRVSRTRGTQLCEVEIEQIQLGRVAGRDVVVVDDIADEGRTLHEVMGLVRRGQPKSLRSAVLVDKRERRKLDVRIDYVGFEVKEGWVVGFGMDLDGRYRDLDYLAVADPLPEEHQER